MPIPLSVLDLSPFGAGQTPGDGLRASIDLARSAERDGYARYWLAEHHLNPGVAGAAPHVLLASIGAATQSIRIGTAATIIGNYSPLQVVEAAGVVSALHPGRFDLGIGRSGSTSSAGSSSSRSSGRSEPSGRSAWSSPSASSAPSGREDRVVDGLVLPAARPFAANSDRFIAQARLLGRVPGDADRFEQDVCDILALIDGTYVAPEAVPLHAIPAEGQDIEVWLHGTTAGPSADLAGRLGLPFGASYHVAPTFVLEAVAAYRRAFVPGRRAAPYVTVSVDVLVADTDAAAKRLSAGYGHWVHSIRAGDGAIPFPDPDWALRHPLDSAARDVVADRLATQFAGSPETVVARLETLQRVTGADELLVTTITHDARDREQSYALLAQAWGLDGAHSRSLASTAVA